MRVAARGPCIGDCSAQLWLTQYEEKVSMTYELRHVVGGEAPDKAPSFSVSALDVELHDRPDERAEFNLPLQAWKWLDGLHSRIEL